MSADTHNTITEAQITAFESDGAILIPSAVAERRLDRLRTATERALATSDNFFRRLRLWENDADFAEFCLRSPAPCIAARLLRTDKVNLFYDQVFVKEPGTSAPTPWHNDQPYWPVRGWPVMTLWVALDPVTDSSGALEFIRGSHRWDRWFQPFLAANDGTAESVYAGREPTFEPLPDFDAERDRLDILRWNMEPGDALAFHALTVHGARGNSHQHHRRRGYAVRYAGKGAVYYRGPAVNPRLVNNDLKPGDPLDSEQYPVAYER